MPIHVKTIHHGIIEGIAVRFSNRAVQVKKSYLSFQASSEDVEIIPVLEFCVSDYMNYWLAAIFTYKGLLLVMRRLL